MFVLITYDVNTETPAGRRRLRHVAKECVNYGHRVQNSVFECIIDQKQYIMLKHDLEEIIDMETDSVRFYNLGNKHRTKIESIGVDHQVDMDDSLIY
ncbi:MAG: CRISPR-associated endonuclease Cas2 [Holdemanella porci]|uniref:CRISPR-associated endonuclease Cas2 n=1 Tax=Holdemanella porci TaxID=2652276 RepID=UPI002431098B|nr:CRISPR-associated endonuclease Cas2 [Holdemanella porci]MDD6453479.1 CRISPR-associated endonuclease Cas2 [Holdemanella porci]